MVGVSDIADRLLFRMVYASDSWEGTEYQAHWSGGGYDVESIGITKEAYDYLIALEDKYELCRRCENVLGDGDARLRHTKRYEWGDHTSTYCRPCALEQGYSDA